jgi:hypothetical protein
VLLLVLLTAAGAALGKISREVVCYVLAAVATTIATLVSFNLWDAWGHYRFHGPFTVVAFHLVLGSWLGSFGWFSGEGLRFGRTLALPVPARLALAGLVFAVVLPLLVLGRDLPRSGRAQLFDLDGTLRSRVKGDYLTALESQSAYAAALATIPAGATILSAVNSPFLLDQRTHQIVCLDEIGTVSPPPGLPLGGSPDDFRAYLTRCSIEYVMFVRPENGIGIYRREMWRAPTSLMWQRRAPYAHWFFDTMEKLAATERKIFETRDAVVVSVR